jgi:hypothetical protein
LEPEKNVIIIPCEVQQMATTDIDTAFWYFKSGDPWSQQPNDEWTKYRDIEMQIIEEAYQKGKSEVLLDKYRINLKSLMQFNRADSSKQRPVRRQLGSKRQECLREERFCSPPPLASAPSYGKLQEWCPFLTEWLKSSAGKKALMDFSSAIDACIDGIMKEAERHQSNSKTEAQWMIEQLQACKTKPRREVSKDCIHLYTRESFLYHVLNIALRDADYSKLDTLGPLCFLIRDHSRTCKQFIGTVYRGAHLSFAAIQSYKQAIGTWRTWPSYTSTSKNRNMAEIRGNMLFIIEITNTKLSAPRAYDVENFSQFPTEEEVLLPAGISFQIVSVEQDPQQKYLIKIQL